MSNSLLSDFYDEETIHSVVNLMLDTLHIPRRSSTVDGFDILNLSNLMEASLGSKIMHHSLVKSDSQKVAELKEVLGFSEDCTSLSRRQFFDYFLKKMKNDSSFLTYRPIPRSRHSPGPKDPFRHQKSSAMEPVVGQGTTRRTSTMDENLPGFGTGGGKFALNFESSRFYSTNSQINVTQINLEPEETKIGDIVIEEKNHHLSSFGRPQDEITSSGDVNRLHTHPQTSDKLTSHFEFEESSQHRLHSKNAKNRLSGFPERIQGSGETEDARIITSTDQQSSHEAHYAQEDQYNIGSKWDTQTSNKISLNARSLHKKQPGPFSLHTPCIVPIKKANRQHNSSKLEPKVVKSIKKGQNQRSIKNSPGGGLRLNSRRESKPTAQRSPEIKHRLQEITIFRKDEKEFENHPIEKTIINTIHDVEVIESRQLSRDTGTDATGKGGFDSSNKKRRKTRNISVNEFEEREDTSSQQYSVEVSDQRSIEETEFKITKSKMIFGPELKNSQKATFGVLDFNCVAENGGMSSGGLNLFSKSLCPAVDGRKSDFGDLANPALNGALRRASQVVSRGQGGLSMLGDPGRRREEEMSRSVNLPSFWKGEGTPVVVEKVKAGGVATPVISPSKGPKEERDAGKGRGGVMKSMVYVKNDSFSNFVETRKNRENLGKDIGEGAEGGFQPRVGLKGGFGSLEAGFLEENRRNGGLRADTENRIIDLNREVQRTQADHGMHLKPQNQQLQNIFSVKGSIERTKATYTKNSIFGFSALTSKDIEHNQNSGQPQYPDMLTRGAKNHSMTSKQSKIETTPPSSKLSRRRQNTPEKASKHLVNAQSSLMSPKNDLNDSRDVQNAKFKLSNRSKPKQKSRHLLTIGDAASPPQFGEGPLESDKKSRRTEGLSMISVNNLTTKNHLEPIERPERTKEGPGNKAARNILAFRVNTKPRVGFRPRDAKRIEVIESHDEGSVNAPNRSQDLKIHSVRHGGDRELRKSMVTEFEPRSKNLVKPWRVESNELIDRDAEAPVITVRTSKAVGTRKSSLEEAYKHGGLRDEIFASNFDLLIPGHPKMGEGAWRSKQDDGHLNLMKKGENHKNMMSKSLALGSDALNKMTEIIGKENLRQNFQTVYLPRGGSGESKKVNFGEGRAPYSLVVDNEVKGSDGDEKSVSSYFKFTK